MIGIAAADHHEVDIIGQPFVTQRRELDQIGPQRLERFQRIGEVAAKSLVLGVSHAEGLAAGDHIRPAQQVRLIGKGTRPRQFSEWRRRRRVSRNLERGRRSDLPASAGRAGAFSRTSRAAGMVSMAPITGSQRPGGSFA